MGQGAGAATPLDAAAPPHAGSWLPAGLACAAIGLVYACVFTVPPLITAFVDGLGFSHSEAGAFMSAYTFAYAAGSIPAGSLADRFGPTPVIALGLGLAGVASVLFTLTTSFPLMLGLRAGVGLAAALAYAPGIALVRTSLGPARASVGVGLFSAALSLGIALSFLVTPLVEDALGWRWPSRLFGACSLAGALLVLALGPHARHRRPGATAPRPARRWAVGRSLVHVCVALFFGMFALYGVLTWAPPFFEEELELSSAQVGLAAMLMAVAAIPGSLLAGWAAQRTGRPVLVVASGLVLVLPVTALGLVSGFGAATILAVAAVFGATIAVIPLFALPGVALDLSAAGRAVGIATTAAMAGAIASTYLGGVAVATDGGYVAAFASVAAAAAATAVALLPIAASPRRRRRSAVPSP